MSRTRAQTWAAGAGLVAAGVVGGGILAGALTANAADTATPTPTSTSRTAEDPSQSHHGTEQLLTGDTKTKVEQAVLAQYPDATIQRTETDDEGVYESHVVTADGQRLTVQVGADFAVTGTQDGDHGGRGHHGDRDGDADD